MKAEKESTDKLIEIVAGSLEQGKDFVLEQAPDVVRQWLAWEWWCSMAVVVIAAAATVVLVWLSWKVWKWTIREDFAPLVIAVVASMLPGITSSVAITYGLYLIKLTVAPKVVLIEYVSHLVR